jgi:hypothetical protein
VAEQEIEVVDEGGRIGGERDLFREVDAELADGGVLSQVVESVRSRDCEDGVEDLKLGPDEAGGADRPGGLEVG